MRTTFIQLLLCFTLLFQSMATAGVPAHHCPMQTAGSVMVMAMDTADLPDCCNDPATYATTGKPCKSGQECHVAQIAIAIPAVGVSPIPTTPPQPLIKTDSLLPSGVVNVWRPPILS